MTKTNKKLEKNENIEQNSLTNAVCNILSDKIPEKDIKKNMPDINDVVKLLREDDLFQNVIKGIVTGEIKDTTGLQDIIQKEMEKEKI
jgi:beta-lactam-binding protein with PASTA domain